MKAPQQSPSRPLHPQPFSDSLPPSDIALSHLIPSSLGGTARSLPGGQAHHLRPPGMAQARRRGTWLWKFEFSTQTKSWQSWLPLSESAGPTTALCLIMTKTSPPARPHVTRPGMAVPSAPLAFLGHPGVTRTLLAHTIEITAPSCARQPSEAVTASPRRGGPAGALGAGPASQAGLPGRIWSGRVRVRVGVGPLPARRPSSPPARPAPGARAG